MAVRAREDRGAWWVFAVHKGMRTKRRVGVGPAGREAAKAVAAKVSAQVALGDLSFFERRPEGPVTFQAYATQWLETTVQARRKLATVESYGRVLKNHWYPAFGSLPLTSITRESIKRVLGGWLAGDTKTGVVRTRLAILASCLASAVDDGRLTTSPARGLAQWSGRSGEVAEPIEVFSNDEVRAILDATHGYESWVYPAVMVMARAGLRPGEMLTLQWTDFDFAAREVTVSRTWSGSRRQQVMNTPKGNKTRKVDCSRQCIEALVAYRDRQIESSEWVFPWKGSAIRPEFFAVRWASVLADAGVRYRNPHTLRHTFASRLIENGESPAYVRDQCGHHSVAFTFDVYGHRLPTERRSAVDKLDDEAPALRLVQSA